MIWARIKAFIFNAWTLYQVPITIFGALLLAGLIWFYGTRIWNGVGSWVWHRGTNQQQAELEKVNTELEKTKAVLKVALDSLAAEKEVTADERKKRIAAEEILADRSKTTNEKLKAYEKAISNVPTHSAPMGTDELCAWAKTLGIECGD